MKGFAILLACLLFPFSIKAQNAFSFKLKDSTGKQYDLSELKNNKGSALIFLSPECPICQKYTLTINQLQKAYTSLGIKFYGIIPGTNFKNKAINKFAKEYGLSLPLLLDADYVLTKSVGATVTPEVILFSPDGVVQYSGKFDNWYEGIGTRRTVITEYYFKQAVNDLLEGKETKVKRTTPIGCFIF